jgi:hypothetical protein
MPNAEWSASSWSILLAVEVTGLFKQKECVTMWCTSWRGSRSQVVRQEWFVGSQLVVGTCCEARLDPVENGSENVEGRKRSVEIKTDYHIGD